MPYLMDSGYTANTATMGHHGTVTVRPSPPKPEQSQGDKALGLLRVRAPASPARVRPHAHAPRVP